MPSQKDNIDEVINKLIDETYRKRRMQLEIEIRKEEDEKIYAADSLCDERHSNFFYSVLDADRK